MLAWVKVSNFSLLKKRNWEKILRRVGDSLSRINVFSYEQCVRLISGNRMVIILYTMQSKAKLTGVLLEVIFFYCFLIVPFLLLTLGRTCKFIPPPWYKLVGWMDPPTRVFDMLQCFEMILPSVESLWYSVQDEVYFMGGGASGGPVTSPKMVAILDFTKNSKSG